MLCRDVYHCTPDALDRQQLITVRDHLTVLRQINKASDTKARLDALPGIRKKSK